MRPQVHWSGVCRNSTQVMDWYRGVLAEGTMPAVHGVEVDRDTIVLQLTLTRRA